ncbi:MAG: glycosyltransferase family 4 protein [Acidobacteria bacterium]|nr:MAG: glycosyltransferase family 4 protein [Acidobacteriota bacterium]
MKIVFVIYSMRAGGAERVAATLVNNWIAAGDQVTIVTIESSTCDFYDLDSRTRRVALDLSRPSRSWREFLVNNFQIIMRLRDLIRKTRPDIVLSFMDLMNLRTLIAASGTRIPVVVGERVDPTQHRIGKVASAARWLLYCRASAVVVQTAGIAQWASRIVASTAIHVIPNPIGDQFLEPSSKVSIPQHKIVGMGRLEPQKGFDLLLCAFAQALTVHPDWTLDIFGEGSERDHLKSLADDLGLADRVSLPGAIKDPERALRQADIFILSSRYEGFPNALLEAMACGLAVISFDCRSGPREMIQHGVNGLLVPPNDVGALAKAMSRLMSAGGERQRLGKRAVEVAERFSAAKVAQMWRSLLEQAVFERVPMAEFDTPTLKPKTANACIEFVRRERR